MRQANAPPATTHTARTAIIAGASASYRIALDSAVATDGPAVRSISGVGAARLSNSSSVSNPPRVRYERHANASGASAAAATTAPEILKYKLFERSNSNPTSEASTV